MHTRTNISVSNTFTQRWEFQSYIDLVIENNYDFQIIECHGNWKNIHGVPQEVIDKMKERWESCL